MLAPRHPLARLLYAWEWLGCRACDRLILDTAAHAAYFTETFRLPAGKAGRVFVGAETGAFRPVTDPPERSGHGEFTVLFYGQFIPLHGIETIVQAAKLCGDDPIRWILIGTGQEEQRIEGLLGQFRPRRLQRTRWVPYAELNAWISRADVCLGIFGNTDKAARVIPNKVFQILAAGKPLITRDSPAIRELLEPVPSVRLVPPADPRALAQAVREQCAEGAQIASADHQRIVGRITPAAISRQLLAAIPAL